MSASVACVQIVLLLLAIILRPDSGAARGFKAPKTMRPWQSIPLKAEENPIYRDPPGKIFRQTKNKFAFPIPNARQANPKELLKKIKKFEPLYMSIEKPAAENTTDKNTFSRRQIFARMPTELKNLHFTVPGSERELGSRASRKLRLWLSNLASCPVLPLWKDFGPTIWPRYVNIGQCSTKKTCSYPKGMRCKPTKHKRIYTLFWVCSETIRMRKGSLCIWVPYPTDVIEKCKCSC